MVSLGTSCISSLVNVYMGMRAQAAINDTEMLRGVLVYPSEPKPEDPAAMYGAAK
jgi:hypothetical protein